MIFFLIFFPENGDNLHEMSKSKEKHINLLSGEYAQREVKVSYIASPG